MANIREGVLRAEGFKFALLITRFNEFITKRLLEGALDALYRHGARDEDLEIVKVPGSFELPLAAKKLALKNQFHAIICLGAIIKGDTPHYEYIAAEVIKGIANTSLETGVPILLGVLTTETIEQAIERAGSKEGNKGWDAALSAIEMVNLYKALE